MHFFCAIYALLCGEILSPKFCQWRKNYKYNVRALSHTWRWTKILPTSRRLKSSFDSPRKKPPVNEQICRKDLPSEEEPKVLSSSSLSQAAWSESPAWSWCGLRLHRWWACPTKRQWQRQIQWQRQRQIHLENTFKERPQSLVTFETFDQSDEGTCPNKQKDKDKDKDNDNDKDITRTPFKSDSRVLWPLRHLIRVMRGHDLTNKKTKTKTMTMTETVTKTIPVTFETLKPILTIENLNSWQSLLPDI